MNDELKTALEAFIVRQQLVIDKNQATALSLGLVRTVLKYEESKKYARLYTQRSAESRSAYGFMDMETGDLYKAGSWKAPAKNFIRGNVKLTELGFSPYGIS